MGAGVLCGSMGYDLAPEACGVREVGCVSACGVVKIGIDVMAVHRKDTELGGGARVGRFGAIFPRKATSEEDFHAD